MPAALSFACRDVLWLSWKEKKNERKTQKVEEGAGRVCTEPLTPSAPKCLLSRNGFPVGYFSAQPNGEAEKKHSALAGKGGEVGVGRGGHSGGHRRGRIDRGSELGEMDGWAVGWTDGRMDGWKGGWKDGWKDG